MIDKKIMKKLNKGWSEHLINYFKGSNELPTFESYEGEDINDESTLMINDQVTCVVGEAWKFSISYTEKCNFENSGSCNCTDYSDGLYDLYCANDREGLKAMLIEFYDHVVNNHKELLN